MKERVLIIGCGYVGTRLQERLLGSGYEALGLRRSGAAEIQADITQPSQLAAIDPDFDFVINLASSTRGGLDDYRAVYFQGTRNVLAWLRPRPPKRYIYTSSTSVYGQNDGRLVTEESPAEPDSATSKVLRETEDLLLTQDQVPAVILRASGIYGPDRGHLFQQFLRGEAVLRGDGSSFINMMHLEDVAGAIEHCLPAGPLEKIYNLTDDEPVTQSDYFAWLAKTLRRPLPPSAPADPNRKRGLTNKRISNARLKSTGYRFQFPTYREGYTAELRRLGLWVD